MGQTKKRLARNVTVPVLDENGYAQSAVIYGPDYPQNQLTEDATKFLDALDAANRKAGRREIWATASEDESANLGPTPLQMLAADLGLDATGSDEVVAARIREFKTGDGITGANTGSTSADSGEGDSKPLTKMGKPELQLAASNLGIEFDANETKADLIAKIESKLNAGS